MKHVGLKMLQASAKQVDIQTFEHVDLPDFWKMTSTCLMNFDEMSVSSKAEIPWSGWVPKLSRNCTKICIP